MVNSVGGYQIDMSVFVMAMLMAWDAEIVYMHQILDVHAMVKTRRKAFSGASRFKNCQLSITERTSLQRIITFCEKERVHQKETMNDLNNLFAYSAGEIPDIVPEEHELTDSDEEAEFQSIKDHRVFNPISREWGPYPTRKTFLAQKEKARQANEAASRDKNNEEGSESKRSTPKGTYTHTTVCACICICICIFVYVYVYFCMYMYMYMCMCMCSIYTLKCIISSHCPVMKHT